MSRRLAAIIFATLLACSHKVECSWMGERPAVCELSADGRITLSRQSLRDTTFDTDGLSWIATPKAGLFFVNLQGKTAPALPFDNGPDTFVEGLARTIRNGKVGFVNTQLDEVVAPVWDFAFPFQSGVAVVCTGCISVGDEHFVRKGGKWGYIDRHGKVVVPVVYDEGSLPPRQ